MIEGPDPFDTPNLNIVGRGDQVGSGVLFIFTQQQNLETNEILQTVRPLRENHTFVIQLHQGQRVVTLDGLTVVTSKQALEVYYRNFKLNPRLGHTVITHVRLLDPSQYNQFIVKGTLP